MSIWTCGPDDGNRLGRLRTAEEPDKIPLPDDLTIVQVAIGWKHGHFFTDNNDFYSWGTGASWRLGTGGKGNLQTPQKVTTFPVGTQFKQVACGDKFSAVTTQSGQLYVWGAGYAHAPMVLEIPSAAEFIACGQICLLVALRDGSVMQFYRHKQPIHHNFVDDRIVSVAAGANHKLALAESGKVYSWGNSPATGQGNVEVPTVIRSLAEVRMSAVFAYHNSSFFLDTQSRVWCCGTNSSGSLGLGHIDDVPNPVPQDFPFEKEQIVQIACGDDFTLYLTANGNVWASGNGGDHRNATGSNETRTRPTLATKLTGKFISQIAVGCFNSAFLENGCPPFNHMTQFRGDFAEFPIPSFPFRATTCDRISVEIDPSNEVIKPFGCRTGDIIQLSEDEQAKIIGVANGGIAVIRQCKNQICILPEAREMESLTKYQLVHRDGGKLVKGRCADGTEVVVDAAPLETLSLGGFLEGDVVMAGGVSEDQVVFGACRDKLWTIDKKGIISPHDCRELKIVSREGKSVEQMITIDGRSFVVEIEDKLTDLIFYEQYGVGFYRGKIGSQFVYSFISTLGSVLILDSFLPCARPESGDVTVVTTTIGFENVSVSVSCEKTAPTGFYRYDRVSWGENRYGSVVGVADGKVAVRSDEQRIESGLVEWLEPNLISLIGRCTKSGTREYLSKKYSVDTSDFSRECKFLPGDRIESPTGARGVVLGIADSRVYAIMDGVKEPIEINEQFKRICCYMEANAEETLDGIVINIAILHCALCHMKPGDKRKSISGRIMWYVGKDRTGCLWFRDTETKMLSKMSLCEIDPGFYEPDVLR